MATKICLGRWYLASPSLHLDLKQRSTFSSKVAERITLQLGVRIETLERSVNLGPLHRGSFLATWSQPRAGHPRPAASAPASRTALQISPCSQNTESLVFQVFYSRRETESFSPHVNHTAQPRTPWADTGGSGQLHHRPSLLPLLSTDLTRYLENQRGQPSPSRLGGLCYSIALEGVATTRGCGGTIRDPRLKGPIHA